MKNKKYRFIKTSKGHYEFCRVESDHVNGTYDFILSKIFPSVGNPAKGYEALIYGHWEYFKTIKEWKAWCKKTYCPDA